MSVKEVTMYRVVCDGCGEGDDGDYYAWSSREDAESVWIESDGVRIDGRHYHDDCLPKPDDGPVAPDVAVQIPGQGELL